MRALAEFAMRGRSQAIGSAAISHALPFIAWLGTAIVSLTILRKGPAEGLIVLLWASLPLVLVTYLGDSSSLLALVGTAIMACLLRVTMSWEITIGSVVLVAGVSNLIFEWTSGVFVNGLVDWYVEFAGQLQQVELTADQARTVLLGFFALGQAYLMVLTLVLARWWQSELYNPGGFQKEFHQVRLSPAVSVPVLALLVVCMVFSETLGRWIPLLTVPMTVAGLALLHWTVKYKEMSPNWLIAAYVTVIFLSQLALPMLLTAALMDSWLNIRERIQSREV